MVNYIGTINNDYMDYSYSVTPDLLDGLQGADTMRGGDGSDTYIVDDLGDLVEEFWDDAPSGYDTVQSSVSFTLSYGIDRLILTGTANNSGTGNALDNDIQGNSGNNTLNGLGGDDTLKGGLGNDALDGGTGSDTADYSDKTLGVTVVLNGATLSTVSVGGIAEDTVVNIENVTGGSGDDSLTGDGNANTLNGNGGNDTISGGEGIDTINGGDGDDTISGGFGAGIDILNGGNGNDTFLITQDDVIDDIDGGADTDTVDGSSATGYGFTVDLGAGTYSSDPVVGMRWITDVENFTGSNSLSDTITGSSGANTLNGLGGNDTISGGAGVDTIDGGNGDDTITGGYDVDILNGGNGDDRFVIEADFFL